MIRTCGFLGIILVAAVSSVASGAPSDQMVLPLKDHWQLQSSAKVEAKGGAISKPDFRAEGWHATSVPRTVLAALVDNGVYPDPYYGLNLKSIPGFKEGRWLRMDETSPFYPPWWYRTTFELPAEKAGRHVTLHLDGINYRANIWLNGKQIADSDQVIGMFRRFEFDITDEVHFGKSNALAVEVSAPGKLPDQAIRSKQLEATTGWDDHNPQPPDANMGVWEDVYITTSGPVRIRNPYVSTKLDVPSLESARLTVSASLSNVTKKSVTCELTGRIESIGFSQVVSLEPNETREVVFSPDRLAGLIIAHPRVWWPHPLGPQELYNLDLEAQAGDRVSDTARVRFGIREITSQINDEGWRYFMVNGKRLLIRGGAWMTSDMLLRLTPKRYEALIRYAREANLNMLRSEGFSIRETDEFYDLCDQYGVMVTQQIFGRTIPDANLAIACIEDMMLRIRNHPSLAHFLGHDETFPSEQLDQAYRDLIAKYIPDRTYQPHSGAFEVEGRFQTGGTRTGTRELWTYAVPTRYYDASEEARAWGFAQSGGIGGIAACVESVRRMMPEDALWPLWSEAMSFHTVIQGGQYFDALVKALNTRYGEPKNIDDFCMTAALMNYESARAMFETYGRNKYSATGITTWKYDAAWPAALTWHYIDWYLLPTGAYFGAKKACESLHVQYSYDDHTIWVVNGRYEDFTGLKVRARVFNLDVVTERYSVAAVTEKAVQTATVDVAADGTTKALTLAMPEGLTKTFFLYLQLTDAAGKPISDNFYWLSTVPDIRGTEDDEREAYAIHPKSVADLTALRSLPRVELKATHGIDVRDGVGSLSVKMENPTDKPAFFVHLAVTKGEGGAEVAPTYWSDNYFALLPGETKQLTATFAMDDLDGASPTLRVGGWNTGELK